MPALQDCAASSVVLRGNQVPRLWDVVSARMTSVPPIDTPEEVATKAMMTCSMTPNQFEGIVDGRAFYFRARWGEWYLMLAEPGSQEASKGTHI